MTGHHHLHRGVVMRTTLNIDDEALDAAMSALPGLTKTDVINMALRELARKERRKGLLALRGKVRWEGDLDRLRKRR
jgi:Arc/MetJ family transcription regulator